MERAVARRWQLTYATCCFIVVGGMAAWRTFHPSSINYQANEDITEHPIASLMGSLILPAIGSVFTYYSSRRMLKALSMWRSCPHCASWIRSKAVVCKHCHRDIVDPLPQAEDKPIAVVSPPATEAAAMTAVSTVQVAEGNSEPSIGLIAGVAVWLLVVVIVIAAIMTSPHVSTIPDAAPHTSTGSAPVQTDLNAMAQQDAQAAVASTVAPPVSDKPAPDAPAPPTKPPTVEEAFNIAYPTPKRLVEIDGKKAVATFSADQLLPLSPTEYVLLSKGQNQENFHAASGYVGISYISTAGAVRLIHPTIVADASDGGWGNPPGLSVIHGITADPVVIASSSFLSTGDMETSIDLIDLSVDPSKLSIMGSIPMSFTDGGNGKHCDIEGTLRPGVNSAWFSIIYTGSWTKTVTYRLRDGKIIPQEKTGNLYAHCPQEQEPSELPAAPANQ